MGLKRAFWTLQILIAVFGCGERPAAGPKPRSDLGFSCPDGIQWDMSEAQLIGARPRAHRNTEVPGLYYEHDLDCPLFNKVMFDFTDGRLQGVILRKELTSTADVEPYRSRFIATALAKWGRAPERLLRSHEGLNRSVQHIPVLKWTSDGVTIAIAYTPSQGPNGRSFNADKDPVIEKYASYLEMRIKGPSYRTNPKAPPPVTPDAVEGSGSIFTDFDLQLRAQPPKSEEYLF